MQSENRYSVSSEVAQGSIFGSDLWNVLYDGLVKIEEPDGVRHRVAYYRAVCRADSGVAKPDHEKG